MEVLEVRNKLMMTQQEMAEVLGVTKKTIERWELGLFKIGKKYEEKLEELCKEYGAEIDIDARAIKYIRKKNNFTQEEFAKYLEVGTSSLRDWEKGRHLPRKEVQKKIYELYKISVKGV